MSLLVAFRNVVTQLQMRYKSIERMRNFQPNYRLRSRYHITVRQINTATHAVRWLIQMLWVRKVQISNTNLKFSHSAFHCDIFS